MDEVLCKFCSGRAHGRVVLGGGTCRRCILAKQQQQAERDQSVSSEQPAKNNPKDQKKEQKKMAKSTGTNETRDGEGAGDHDAVYAFGHPREYLTLMVQARLLIMRGYVMDARAGEKGGAADGDIDWLMITPASAIVPAVLEPALPSD